MGAKTLQQVAFAMQENELADPCPPTFKTFKEQFYEFSNALKKVQQMETREEILHFGDIILEYKQLMPYVKKLMNRRIDLLEELTQAMNKRLTTSERRQKLKLKLAETSEELMLAVTEDEKVSIHNCLMFCTHACFSF